MKKTELQKLREKSLDELKKQIINLKKELAKVKLEKGGGKLKNVKLLAKLKKDLAQTLTVLEMKEYEVETLAKGEVGEKRQ